MRRKLGYTTVRFNLTRLSAPGALPEIAYPEAIPAYRSKHGTWHERPTCAQHLTAEHVDPRRLFGATPETVCQRCFGPSWDSSPAADWAHAALPLADAVELLRDAQNPADLTRVLLMTRQATANFGPEHRQALALAGQEILEAIEARLSSGVDTDTARRLYLAGQTLAAPRCRPGTQALFLESIEKVSCLPRAIHPAYAAAWQSLREQLHHGDGDDAVIEAALQAADLTSHEPTSLEAIRAAAQDPASEDATGNAWERIVTTWRTQAHQALTEVLTATVHEYRDELTRARRRKDRVVHLRDLGLHTYDKPPFGEALAACPTTLSPSGSHGFALMPAVLVDVLKGYQGPGSAPSVQDFGAATPAHTPQAFLTALQMRANLKARDALAAALAVHAA